MNFWHNLKKPIIGLAPMDGVTDFPYRFIQGKYGNPDVSFTEFIPVEGIVRLSERLLMDFWYAQEERPIVAQVYGNKPEMFYASAQLVCELGFDGVDINMGCPARSVVHSGSGAALIKNPDLAVEIIQTVQQAVLDWEENNGIVWEKWQVLDPQIAKKTFTQFVETCKQNGLYQDLDWEKNKRRAIPVSVKTRIGFASPVVEEWIPTLLSTKPAVITLHGRTLKQLYTGFADWEEVGKAVSLRDQSGTSTLILGNGDIKSTQDIKDKLKIADFDGFLIGRGTYGNPWIFAEAKGEKSNPTIEEKFSVMIEHAHLHEKYKSEEAFMQMRKNLAWYVSGIHGAAALRGQLVKSNSAQEVEDIIHFWFKNANISSP
jgi:tRNA-dihydrouridine synthase B